MASFHQTIIIGNLGRDPEARHMASGDMAANFAVAVTEGWKDKNTGERKEETTWYRVSMFGKLAEIACQYLKKGSQVQVIGKMKERKWTDKDGQERTTWELRGEQMTMLGSRQQDGGSGQTDHGRAKADGYAPPPQQARAPEQRQQRPAQQQQFEDDVPF